MSAFVLIGLAVAAQPVMYKKGDWKAGETKVVSGTRLKKVEGRNSDEIVTNIGYQTQKQLFADLKERKKTGAIGGDRYKNEQARYQQFCAGGLVQLYLLRSTEEACNPGFFHLDVKDKEGKVVFQKDLKEEKAIKMKDGSGYKCQSLAFIKAETYLPLTIELTEKYNGETFVYVYEVEPIEK